MREIILDTETTGLDPDKGDRIVEIACLELVNRLPSANDFHCYINPECAMSQEAENVHGLSTAFLADKPLFADIADEFSRFIAGAVLVIHNAAFDIKFINAELARAGRPILGDKVKMIDTLELARKKFPGAPASLDALCRRFNVDNSGRDLHGAQIDCQLLAEVYLQLSGGRQPGLVFQTTDAADQTDKKPLEKAALSATDTPATAGQTTLPNAQAASMRPPQKRRSPPLPPRLTEAESAAHAAFLKNLPTAALWLK